MLCAEHRCPLAGCELRVDGYLARPESWPVSGGGCRASYGDGFIIASHVETWEFASASLSFFCESLTMPCLPVWMVVFSYLCDLLVLLEEA